MTLCKGDHIVKLDKDGKPLTTDREMYIEYVVEELTPYFTWLPDGGTRVVVMLLKVK